MNVLILCTGNSCRSILAEVLFNEVGDGRFKAFSAGSQPAGTVNPGAIAKLKQEQHSVAGLSSKSWDEYSMAGAPRFDIVITVCDSAAAETCPVWHGSPVVVHWGIPDPADAADENRSAAFDLAYQQLKRRVEQTLEIPFESMEPRLHKDALQRVHDAACVEERLRH